MLDHRFVHPTGCAGTGFVGERYGEKFRGGCYDNIEKRADAHAPPPPRLGRARFRRADR